MTSSTATEGKEKEITVAQVLKKYGAEIEIHSEVGDSKIQEFFRNLFDGQVVKHVLEPAFFQDMEVLHNAARQRGLELTDNIFGKWGFRRVTTSFCMCKLYLYEACFIVWIFKDPYYNLDASIAALRKMGLHDIVDLIEGYAYYDERENLVHDYLLWRERAENQWDFEA
ncbi:MAG: hypothetical protein L6Q71_01560 [Planctomycetes bacterium]|nr:hypothetical protein [Planctomycetota bacterium]NUQ35577.1 hypothetical protein [Planctomycetaceae bacterium]